MYNKILVPTDGSTYANQEVERVKKLISEDGEIIVLSVAGKLTSSAFQSRRKVRKVNDILQKEAQQAVDNMASKFEAIFSTACSASFLRMSFTFLTFLLD